MSRSKKDGKFLNCYIRRDIMDTLDDFSSKSLIPKTAIVEEALKQYFDRNILSDKSAVPTAQSTQE